MRLFIVFAAIFVILSHDGMSYGLEWYQNLKPDSHESSSSKSSSSGESSSSKESASYVENSHNNESSPSSESSPSNKSSPSSESSSSSGSSFSSESSLNKERLPSTESSTKNENSPSLESTLTNETSLSNEGSSRNQSSLGAEEILIQIFTSNNYLEQIPTATRSTAKITRPTTTPLVTETATDKNRYFLKCVNLCPVTTEYNPVCGTNFVTYTNLGSLNCAKSCGLDVKIKSFFACQESNVGPETTTDVSHGRVLTTSTTIKPEATYKPLDVTINPTTTEFHNVQNQGFQFSTTTRPTMQITIPPPTTMTPSTAKRISYNSSDFYKCVRLCHVTPEYNPVCGSNLVTYTNPGTLICLKSCGSPVYILLRSPCPPNIAQISSTTQLSSTTTTAKTTITTAKTTTTTARTTTTTARTTTKTANWNSKTNFVTLAQQQCVQSCDNSTEWRPVCGSNDVTYRNAYRLLCAQKCGIDVSLKKKSICMDEGSELTSSTTLKSIETVTDVTLTYICVRNCDVTPEYNPVCGTDNKTYKNPSFVQCLITCGTGIQIKHRYPCSQENKTDEGINTSTPSNMQPTTTSKKSSQEICIDECLKNKTHKPVCGSNNVTYINSEHLRCARTCQVDVTLETYLPCGKSSAEPEITNNENPKKVLSTSTTNELKTSNKPIDDVTDPESKKLFNIPTMTEPHKNVEINLRSNFTR